MPETCFERLEAQGSKRARKVRKQVDTDWDSRAKLTRRWNRILKKRRKVRMPKERLEYTKGVVMNEVDNGSFNPR
jgi:hypothetical protein